MNTDDELFASLVAGERDEDDAQVRELLARRPQLREKARDMVALRKTVDQDARLEREVIAVAKRETTAADRARVERALRVGAGVRRPFAWRRVVTLAAAAAVVLGAALYFQSRSDVPQPDEFLNVSDAGVSLDAPDRALRAGVAVTWTAVDPSSERRLELSSNESWKVSIHAVGEDGRSDKLLFESRCATATWTPRITDVESWPERVLLTVHRVELGPDGRELASSPPYLLQVSR